MFLSCPACACYQAGASRQAHLIIPTWMSLHAERLAASSSKAESSSQWASSSRRKSGKGADVEAQLSAAKLKLEEHLSRLVEEEPASPEPEQVPHIPVSVQSMLSMHGQDTLAGVEHEDGSRSVLDALHLHYPHAMTPVSAFWP